MFDNGEGYPQGRGSPPKFGEAEPVTIIVGSLELVGMSWTSVRCHPSRCSIMLFTVFQTEVDQ
jgi:hypothetical protein